MKNNRYLPAILAFSILIPAIVSAQTPNFTDEQICMGTISLLMVQKASIMKAKKTGGEVIVSYKRPSDGQFFENKCLIKDAEKEVIWAAKFDTGWGRWRDSKYDPVISYQVSDGHLIIDEDGNSKKFTTKDFRK